VGHFGAEAKHTIEFFEASGTDAVAKALGLATNTFGGNPATNHALLLTDGIAHYADTEIRVESLLAAAPDLVGQIDKVPASVILCEPGFTLSTETRP
jgi:hypothetical protein